jgi:hypothetical protein
MHWKINELRTLNSTYYFSKIFSYVDMDLGKRSMKVAFLQQHIHRTGYLTVTSLTPTSRLNIILS